MGAANGKLDDFTLEDGYFTRGSEGRNSFLRKIKPNPPCNVTIVDVTATTVTLKWNKPFNYREHGVMAYRVEYQAYGQDTWTMSASHCQQLSHQVKYLKTNTIYKLRVKSLSLNGKSYGAESDFIRTKEFSSNTLKSEMSRDSYISVDSKDSSFESIGEEDQRPSTPMYSTSTLRFLKRASMNMDTSKHHGSPRGSLMLADNLVHHKKASDWVNDQDLEAVSARVPLVDQRSTSGSEQCDSDPERAPDSPVFHRAFRKYNSLTSRKSWNYSKRLSLPRDFSELSKIVKKMENHHMLMDNIAKCNNDIEEEVPKNLDTNTTDTNDDHDELTNTCTEIDAVLSGAINDIESNDADEQYTIDSQQQVDTDINSDDTYSTSMELNADALLASINETVADSMNCPEPSIVDAERESETSAKLTSERDAEIDSDFCTDTETSDFIDDVFQEVNGEDDTILDVINGETSVTSGMLTRVEQCDRTLTAPHIAESHSLDNTSVPETFEDAQPENNLRTDSTSSAIAVTVNDIGHNLRTDSSSSAMAVSDISSIVSDDDTSLMSEIERNCKILEVLKDFNSGLSKKVSEFDNWKSENERLNLTYL
ncbi:unnamed protein product [Owenia fusiformis]|uniref:Uncharacterized protein n=1 Tax=Owenia fusiformis TaxID=6347 RepID=A0A8J1Y4Z0_OWEFU|nr:unnamed protein product [Owenia fusiformis]